MYCLIYKRIIQKNVKNCNNFFFFLIVFKNFYTKELSKFASFYCNIMYYK